MTKLILLPIVIASLLSTAQAEIEVTSNSSSSNNSTTTTSFETYEQDGYIIEEEIEETYVIEELGDEDNVKEETVIEKSASQQEVKDKGMTINLKDVGVRFATNSWILSGDNITRLNAISMILAKHPNLWSKLCISGHTDERGSHSFNMNLSRNRVQTVNSILVSQGVPATKLCTKAFGETQPIDPAHNAYAWEKNRRVELKLFGIDQNSPLATALAALFKANASLIPTAIVRHKTTTIIKNASTNVPVLTRQGDTYTINLYQAGVHFEFDKARLRKGSKRKLQEISRLLKRNNSQWSKMVLAGHTDKRGSQKYNMALASRRTKAVGNALLQNGISRRKVTARAYGENQPLTRSTTEYAHAKNRRVEIRLSGVRADSRLAQRLEAYFKRQ